MENPEVLLDQLAALEESLGSSAAMVAAFDGEMARMRETMVFTGREMDSLSRGLGGGLRRAFDGLVFDGMKLSDALRGVGKAISDTIYGIAMKPVTGAVGGALAETLTKGWNAGMPGGC